MNTPLYEQALKYANKAGFTVFPLKPHSKIPDSKLLHARGYTKVDDPHIGSWFPLKKKKPTQEDLAFWFNTPHPTPPNIAMVTGLCSNVTVIDLDKPKDATQNPTPVEDLLPLFPPTLTQRSGSGGYHLLYSYTPDIKCSTGVYREQVDTKNNGGYIVLAPSIHPDTHLPYVWTKTIPLPLPPTPLDLLLSLDPARSSKAKDTDWPDLFSGVEFGRLNTSATKVAGKLLANMSNTLPLATIFQLFQGWNALNKPPITEKELLRIFKSITSSYYGQNKHRQQ